ncbi:hypothetical protein STRCI_008329 [Streptomyces cinnabarinus]|uniref:Uncharacterized protein n=1 Tax=Streptomyces cinnabarinus TaxID=67287 RepID=A0ABY7KSV5_9ACTN|nr:hypothetical protein [Streptomyces cinnabarinus]WAZ26710.1 hypothetical protein STRCI_008329 [Streptomyces cinnabarinus]
MLARLAAMLAGWASARFSEVLTAQASKSMLLRLICLPDQEPKTPHVVGVDS